MKKMFAIVIALARGIFLFLLLVASFAYAMFQGGFVSWFLFYSFLFVMVTSIASLFFPLRSISIERKVNKDTFMAGEDMEVTVTVTRKKHLPYLYVTVRDVLPPAMMKEADQSQASAVSFFSFKQEQSFQYTCTSVNRGEYQFAEVEVRTGDIFGFVQKKQTLTVKSDVFVYPTIRPLQKWSIVASQSENEVAATEGIEEALVVSGVREYVPGDRLASIDWKVSARKDELMTKEFDSVKGEGYTVVLDTFCSHEMLFERVVEFVASVTDHYMKRKRPLGFEMINDPYSSLPTDRGMNHYRAIFKRLAKVKLQHQAMTAHLKRSSPNETFIVISAVLNMETIARLQPLFKPDDHVVFFFMKEDEEEQQHQVRSHLWQKGILHYVVSESLYDMADE
ncbi:DUF58 domain-containing protein [Desertibacillus haloalkaliphilus]|uniref:DUF58 domain-containing protein n=1 Tax=Desertibacillus haloalkaliphilus TaxID=1328930 RepID=UPI001C2550E3|nr:DUF58 domain-containing protein [Desertibacillus haloalkaliphilus]MBU8906358.1 DUF58 domain-containing protein [Desertibacillus haloalkaliphilus]